MTGIFYVHPAMAGASVDQKNDNVGGALSGYVPTGFIAQTFKPSYQHLDKVEIYLKNREWGKWLDVYILDFHQVEVAHTGHRIGSGDGWEEFSFDVDLTKEAIYAIRVLGATIETTNWPFTGNEYSRGEMWYEVGKASYANDLLFKTWGTDPVEMVEEETNPGSDQTPEQTDVSSTTGEAPSSAVSTSITKPSELTATYSNGVQLAWKASTTTDIDGYAIFRSETKGKGYSKITSVAKTEVSYLDQAAAASKTYYYVIRATKGGQQSANSNEASITIPENAKLSTPQNFKVKTSGPNYIGVAWDKNSETNISGYELTIAKGTEKIETVQTVVSKNTYLFKNLDPVTEYTITLVAKNSGGEKSAEAVLSASTSAELSTVASTGYQMNALSWGMLGVAVVLIGMLIFMIVKRRKAKKISESGIS